VDIPAEQRRNRHEAALPEMRWADAKMLPLLEFLV
jgi:hypothetical protein